MTNDDAHPRELLSPYLDGELDPDERRRVTEHLERCAGCRVLLDDLRALATGIAAEEPPLPPADLAARIGRGVGDLGGEAKVIPIRRPLWHSPLVLSSMAAVLAGIMVTVVWLSSRPAAKRQEFDIVAEKTTPPPAKWDGAPVPGAKGKESPERDLAAADAEVDEEAPSSAATPKTRKATADAPATRQAVPLPQSAQERIAVMEQSAARAARPKAAPPPPQRPVVPGKEEPAADDLRIAADVADLDAPRSVGEGHGAGAAGEGVADGSDAGADERGAVAALSDRAVGSNFAAAPGGPPVAEPPPARSLELWKSDYRAVLSEAGALSFVAGSYECVVPVISPAGASVPPASPVDLRTEIREIFALAAAEQKRRAATMSEEEGASVSPREDQAVLDEAHFEKRSMYLERSAPPEIVILRDADERLLYRTAIFAAREGGAASPATPIAERLDRLIREHYLALMERGCGPLPPELQEGE